MLRRAVALPIALLAVFTVLLIWQVNGLLTASDAVRRTNEVVASIHRLEKLLVDTETGERGYLPTAPRGMAHE